MEVPWANRVCQHSSSAAIDDAGHMVFDSSDSESHQCHHPSLFTRGSRSLSEFMDQDPTEVAAFVFERKKSCLASDMTVWLASRFYDKSYESEIQNSILSSPERNLRTEFVTTNFSYQVKVFSVRSVHTCT